MGIQFLDTQVNKIEEINYKVYRAEFEILSPEKVNYEAGQFFTLEVGERARRSYSCSLASGELTKIETYVDISPNGPGSQFFKAAANGDRLKMIGPMGRFTHNLPPADLREGKKLTYDVFLATGTGIVPFISMLRTIAQQRDEGINPIIPRQISLFWGLRHEKDLYLQTELDKLASSIDGFEYFITLSQPQSDWKGLTGYNVDYLKTNFEIYNAPENYTRYFLCGNGNMINHAREFLSANQIRKEDIFFEKFY